jgi:hypothetical protein
VDVPRPAEPLLSLPPPRFVAERNALAKALAGKGDPVAGAVRKIPRPVGLAWVLNRLARERPRDVEALFAAGDRLRAGQRRALSGAGAGEMREAEGELRARARALRSEAERILAAEDRPAAPTALARIELLLRTTAPARGPVRDALGRGVLLREPEIASGELGGLSVVAGGRAAEAGAAARVVAPATAARASPAEARRRRAQEQRERSRAERDRRARERLVAQARRAADAAKARAAREERAAEAARERSRRATERATGARAEATRLAERLRELEGRP